MKRFTTLLLALAASFATLQAFNYQGTWIRDARPGADRVRIRILANKTLRIVHPGAYGERRVRVLPYIRTAYTLAAFSQTPRKDLTLILEGLRHDRLRVTRHIGYRGRRAPRTVVEYYRRVHRVVKRPGYAPLKSYAGSWISMDGSFLHFARMHIRPDGTVTLRGRDGRFRAWGRGRLHLRGREAVARWTLPNGRRIVLRIRGKGRRGYGARFNALLVTVSRYNRNGTMAWRRRVVMRPMSRELLTLEW